ncbi:hypothetical protein JCM3775_001534 [Rhodotorula graminis]
MDELRCNSLRCRKSLAVEGTAVVTTCSHIFCIECANALFSTPQVCPACETSLPDLDDVAQMTFNPHDSWKTSILSGMSPTTILDIASRALNFYTYQVQQEGAFQALITKNAQERIAVLESQCNTITRDAHAEIRLLKDRVKAAEEGLALERRRAHELQETHRANAKAYTKLKAQYDKAKQRALLQPGEAASFPAALHGVGAGSTPAHTPRVGSTARQTFVAAGAHSAQQHQQQYRASSTLSHAPQQNVGASWTPHGPSHGAGSPYTPSHLWHAQQQPSSRSRRTLVPEPPLQQQHPSAASGAGRFSNASGSGSGGGRTPGSAGSAGSGGGGGGQHKGGAYRASPGGSGAGASGFLGQPSAGGGGFGGGGRGGFRPAQPHSRPGG